ncbi:MAG TPA: hypothetical protein VMH39_05255 [Gemmatimonadaceae bacterium]|nr:hypothetical protein [Gemmatimonadaceae bacterium]
MSDNIQSPKETPKETPNATPDATFDATSGATPGDTPNGAPNGAPDGEGALLSPLERDVLLLADFLAGELSDEESAALRRRIRHDPEFYAHVEPVIAGLGYQMLARGIEPTQKIMLKGSALPALLASPEGRVERRPEESAPPPAIIGQSVRRSWFGRRTRKAARFVEGVFAALGVVFVVLISQYRTTRTNGIAQINGRSNPSATQPEFVVNTGPGQTRVIAMDHGTTVTLRPGGRLSYRLKPTGLIPTGHKAALDGEALLDVREPWILETAVAINLLSPGRYAIRCDTTGGIQFLSGTGIVQVFKLGAIPGDSVMVRPGQGLELSKRGLSLLTTDLTGYPSLAASAAGGK